MRTTDLRGLLASLAALAVITVVCVAWLHVTNATIAALSYLLVVVVAAAFSTLSVAVASSIAAVVLLNYFFLPPVRTFVIAEPQNWVALAVLLLVSLLASHLSSSARSRAEEATARRDELSRLFALSRDILLTTETSDAYAELARSTVRHFHVPYIAIYLPGPAGWQIHEAGDASFAVPHQQLEAIFQAAGRATDFGHGNSGSGRTTIHGKEGPTVDVVTLQQAGRPVGLLAVGGAIEAGTLDAVAGILAIAVERVQLLEERKQADVARQSSELKSALLASLAHDLRTPLTAIRVAASNLHGDWATPEEKRSQGEIVMTEVARLNRLFENVLEMARIETNGVTAAREWVLPEEIIEAALAHVGDYVARHVVNTSAAGTDCVHVDPRLTSTALAHLIENAAQYSPAGSAIEVAASTTSGGLQIVVDDYGPGVADEDLPRLFDRFFRGRAASGRSAGAGMGLAITQGLLSAEDGTVSAANRTEGGARFVITVPAEVRPVRESEDPT